MAQVLYKPKLETSNIPSYRLLQGNLELGTAVPLTLGSSSYDQLEFGWSSRIKPPLRSVCPHFITFNIIWLVV